VPLDSTWKALILCRRNPTEKVCEKMNGIGAFIRLLKSFVKGASIGVEIF
jgi:hypothetical protein